MLKKYSLKGASNCQSVLLMVLLMCLFVIPALANQDYKIGARDIIKISVYEEADLTKTVRVTTEGMVSFPLLGSLKVAGLTVTGLEQKLTQLLGKDYLINPQVSVFVEEYHSKKVFVLGAVNKPGAYELMGEATVLEMISRAEGITEDGGNSLMLLRNQLDPKTLLPLGISEPIVIDLNALLVKGDITRDVKVEDKDVIHIPRADSIYVLGEVKSPGSFKLEDKSITVMQAVTMAGGLTRIAAPRRTKVIRVDDGHERSILVDLKEIMEGNKHQDIVLKAEDMVIVAESFF